MGMGGGPSRRRRRLPISPGKRGIHESVHPAFKVILGARLGMDCDGTRAPLLELSETQKQELLQKAEEVGAL